MKRIATEGVIDRVADRTARIGKALNRRLWVNDPCTDRQVLLQNRLATMEDAGSRVGVDVNDFRIDLAAQHWTHRISLPSPFSSL